MSWNLFRAFSVPRAIRRYRSILTRISPRDALKPSEFPAELIPPKRRTSIQEQCKLALVIDPR